jgi:hypothetical protein
MDGIGMRVDGQANHDLDPGAIIALSPGLADDQEALDVYNSWGPGMYDPRFNQDGMNHPVVIPSIYGLKDVPLETYTGDGPVSYWNASRASRRWRHGNFRSAHRRDGFLRSRMITRSSRRSSTIKRRSRRRCPPTAVDEAASNAEKPSSKVPLRHVSHGTRHTDIDLMIWHAPDETGMDPITAQRSATGMYRTTPLRGLLANGPYFHDGSAETLADVVEHYDTTLSLGLSTAQQADIVEYLKSL